MRSPIPRIADPRTHAVIGGVGLFSASGSAFRSTEADLCFVNVNDLLGFEIGDIKTGKALHQVKVTGYEKGPVKRHGCPSHGIALTPTRKRSGCRRRQQQVHIFDATVMPPKQIATIGVRDQPGWITFSLDGGMATSPPQRSSDTATKKIVATLSGRGPEAPSRAKKMVEVVFANGKPVNTGDQFGIGRRR